MDHQLSAVIYWFLLRGAFISILSNHWNHWNSCNGILGNLLLWCCTLGCLLSPGGAAGIEGMHRISWISKVDYIMRVLLWKKIGFPTFSFLVDALIFRSHDLPTWNFRTWMNAQIPRWHKPPSWVRSAFGGCEQKMTHEQMTNAGALLSFTTANIAFLTLFFLHPNKYIYRKGTSHQRTGVAPPTLWLFIGASTAFVAAFFTL